MFVTELIVEKTAENFPSRAHFCGRGSSYWTSINCQIHERPNKPILIVFFFQQNIFFKNSYICTFLLNLTQGQNWNRNIAWQFFLCSVDLDRYSKYYIAIIFKRCTSNLRKNMPDIDRYFKYKKIELRNKVDFYFWARISLKAKSYLFKNFNKSIFFHVASKTKPNHLTFHFHFTTDYACNRHNVYISLQFP